MLKSVQQFHILLQLLEDFAPLAPYQVFAAWPHFCPSDTMDRLPFKKFSDPLVNLHGKILGTLMNWPLYELTDCELVCLRITRLPCWSF